MAQGGYPYRGLSGVIPAHASSPSQWSPFEEVFSFPAHEDTRSRITFLVPVGVLHATTFAVAAGVGGVMLLAYKTIAFTMGGR